MHPLPPLKPRFPPLASSSFLIGLLLVVVLVTSIGPVHLVMTTATVTLWPSLVSSLMASLMATLMTALMTTLMTSLSSPLEPSRTSSSLHAKSLHSILKTSRARPTFVCPPLLSVHLASLKFGLPALLLSEEASLILVKLLLTAAHLTLVLPASRGHRVVRK